MDNCEVSERTIADLRAQVTRLQADSTAELLKHRERRELIESLLDQNIRLVNKLAEMTDKYCAAISGKEASR